MLSLVGVESVDVVVEGLVPDGVRCWLAHVKAPALGIDWPEAYLSGDSEEDAYNDAVEQVIRTADSRFKMAQRGRHLREQMGEQVRVAWIAWAKTQPEEVQRAHPHWFTEWRELDPASQEADRAIAEHLIRWLDMNGHHIEYTSMALHIAGMMRQAEEAKEAKADAAATPTN